MTTSADLQVTQQGASNVAATASINLKGIGLSLVAWVVFSVTGRVLGPDGIGWAASVALLVAAAALLAGRKSGTKLLDMTAVTTFGVLTLAAFLGGAGLREAVLDFGRAGCTFVLGIVMTISVFTVPFTEPYARHSVPRQLWGTATFRRVNRATSGIWAGAILVMAVGHLVDGLLADGNPTGHAPIAIDLLLNWAVPIVLVYLGVVMTKRVVGGVRSHAPAAAA